MSGPIPFLQPDENGLFHLDKRAAKILNAIKTPVSVVCVSGPYRTGKSYLLNRLIYNENDQENGQNGTNSQKPSGFNVGNSINACTKGIWLWSEPYYNEATKTTYIFLDTEGLNSTGEEVTFDTQIFSLSVLLSSVFILNTQNSITESELEQLELVAECSKKISFQRNSGNNDDDSNNDDIDSQLALHFPRLIWVLRDFALELVDKDNNPITPNQYLEKTLLPLPPGKRSVEEKNRIRKCIRDCFIKRDCIPLPRPVNDEKDLQKLQNVPVSKLRPEFQEGIRHLKMRSLQLYGHFKSPLPQSQNMVDTVKYIDHKPVTGDVLCGLAKVYCEAINSGEIPTILSAWQSVLENKKLSIVQEMVGSMEKYLWNLVQPEQGNQQHGRGDGNNQNNNKNQKNPKNNQNNQQDDLEGEFDVDIITSKYNAQLVSFEKQLNTIFPGDQDSIQTTLSIITTKSVPTLEKVCMFASIKAREFNQLLFTKILSRQHPTLNIPFHQVFPSLSTYDLNSGQKPTNNATVIQQSIEMVLELWRKEAKGKDKVQIEKEVISNLTTLVIAHQSETIVSTGTAYVDSVQRAEHLKGKLENARKQVNGYKEQCDQYAKQIQEYSAQITTLRDENASTQIQLNTVSHKLELASEQLDNAKNEKKTLQSDFNSTKQRLQQDIESLHRQLNDANQSTQSTQLVVAKTQGDLKAALKEKHNAETRIDELTAQIGQLTSEIKSLRSQQEEQRANITSKDGEVGKLNKKLQSKIDSLNNAENQINRLTNQIDALTGQLSAVEKESNKFSDIGQQNKHTITQLESQVNKMDKKIQEMNRVNTELVSNIDENNDTINSLNYQVSQLNKNCQMLENDKNRDEKKMQEYIEEIETLQNTIQTLQTQQRRASFQQQLSPQGPTKRKSTEQPKAVKKSRVVMANDDDDDDGSDDTNYQSHFDANDDDDDNNNFSYDYDVVDDDDEVDSDEELESVAKRERNRRRTVLEDMDDGNNTGWSSKWTSSPAKIPDQAKIIERRKRDGSIFPEQNDGASSSGKAKKGQSVQKHQRVIDPGFKKAAKMSANIIDDEEQEYQRLKAEQQRGDKKKSKKMVLPMDAPEMCDPQTRTLVQLKSWLTAFDVVIPAKPTKAALVALVKKADPRFQDDGD